MKRGQAEISAASRPASSRSWNSPPEPLAFATVSWVWGTDRIRRNDDMQPVYSHVTLKGRYIPPGSHHQDENKDANPDNECAQAYNYTGNQEHKVSETERE